MAYEIVSGQVRLTGLTWADAIAQFRQRVAINVPVTLRDQAGVKVCHFDPTEPQ